MFERKSFASMLLALAVTCAPAACASARQPAGPLTQPEAQAAQALLELPAWSPTSDWSALEPLAFELLVEREFPPRSSRPITRAGRNELAEALDRMDPNSVRAAVLLSRSRQRASSDMLLRRLEKRIEGPDSASDAGDVTAAAALALYPGDEKRKPLQRLLPLAVGEKPHPDLEVRVEIARALVLQAHDEPIPFLLQVLRIDTWVGQKDQRDFKTSPQTAWARNRAAEVLSARAEVPCTYRSDGPIKVRELETLKLEEALRTAGAL